MAKLFRAKEYPEKMSSATGPDGWEYGSGKSGEKALAPREAEKLLDYCRVLDHEALLAVAIQTGIRRGDIVRLEWANIDLEQGWIRFYEEKKDGKHKVPVSGRALKLLRQLYNVQGGDERFVWPSDRSESGHISSRHAWNVLDKWLNAAGLDPRPFHALRATAIKLAQYRGWEIEQVMALTNDSFETIKRHYDVPSESEMSGVAREDPIL